MTVLCRVGIHRWLTRDRSRWDLDVDGRVMLVLVTERRCTAPGCRHNRWLPTGMTRRTIGRVR